MRWVLKQEIFTDRMPFPSPNQHVKLLKDDRVPDWGQLAATMLTRQVRNTVMAVWAALPSDFKTASLLWQ